MIEGHLARQLAQLRRPNGRELLPREKEYLKALEQMEAEGKIPKIKVHTSQLPNLMLNHGIARGVKTHLDRAPHLGGPQSKYGAVVMKARATH